MTEAGRYFLQRGSALVMAPLVLVHLGLMIYAIHGGLDAGEILGRTRGSLGWALYYGLFVVAAATHAWVGLRNVIVETLPVGRRVAGGVSGAFALAVAALGLFAVYAVTAP